MTNKIVSLYRGDLANVKFTIANAWDASSAKSAWVFPTSLSLSSATWGVAATAFSCCALGALICIQAGPKGRLLLAGFWCIAACVSICAPFVLNRLSLSRVCSNLARGIMCVCASTASLACSLEQGTLPILFWVHSLPVLNVLGASSWAARALSLSNVELFNGRVMIHRKFHPPSVAAAADGPWLAAHTRCRGSCRALHTGGKGFKHQLQTTQIMLAAWFQKHIAAWWLIKSIIRRLANLFFCNTVMD